MPWSTLHMLTYFSTTTEVMVSFFLSLTHREELDCGNWRNWPGSDRKPASQRRCVCVCVCARARTLGCQVKCLSHSAGCGENRSWMVSVWQIEPVLLSSPPIRPASLQPGCSLSLSQGLALLGGCAVCVVTGPVKPRPADLLVSEALREQNSPRGRRENWGPGSLRNLLTSSVLRACRLHFPYS